MSISKKTVYYAQLFEKIGILSETQKEELLKTINKNKNTKKKSDLKT
ncbi:hypothetical protein [Alkalihalobacillus deserti]|nr:hypothetical protein [Alkalihalobacillus deserti]